MIRLVVDCNVIFSALISPSVTRELLYRGDLSLVTPNFVKLELGKHYGLVLRKSGMSELEFERLISNVFERIVIQPDWESDDFRETAIRVTPDYNDWPYFALALQQHCGIWSNDKALQRQRRVRVFSTPDLLLLLNNR